MKIVKINNVIGYCPYCKSVIFLKRTKCNVCNKQVKKGA